KSPRSRQRRWRRSPTTSCCSTPVSIRCASRSWSRASRTSSGAIPSRRPMTWRFRSRSAISSGSTSAPPGRGAWRSLVSDNTMLDQCADVASLRDWLNEADRDRHLHGLVTSVALADLARGTSLGGRLPELAGRSVLVATGDQLTAALVLIELDGVARRLILCPPDLAVEHLPTVIAEAEVDAIVTSGQMDASGELGVRLHVVCHPAIAPMAER